MANRVLELLKTREKTYMALTEQALKAFIHELKTALEKEFYQGKTVELFLTDINIVPQNFRFARIEGKVNTNDIGQTITTATGEEVEITLENFWDFSSNLVLIIPFSLLDEADPDMLANYIKQLKENSLKMPEGVLKENSISTPEEQIVENSFTKVDKTLDDVQLMALKLLKSISIH